MCLGLLQMPRPFQRQNSCYLLDEKCVVTNSIRQVSHRKLWSLQLGVRFTCDVEASTVRQLRQQRAQILEGTVGGAQPEGLTAFQF